jgi:hypothetical protein
MLRGCKAIVIGKTGNQVASLVAMARRCGFAFVEEPATGEIPTPKTMIAYLLVHYKVGDDLLLSIIHAIRSGNNDIRFSPIIVIADDCEFELVLHFVELGVDDVISLPEKRDVLVQRLAGQLWSEHLYVETPDYFGPDRRRLEGADHSDDRRTGTVSHARFIIQRIPDFGTKIVRHQISAAPQAAPAVHRVG